jgi:oxygen-dependent protoporphyrinogen oxidase
MGGVRRQDIYQLPENDIVEILKREFCDLMQLTDFQPELLKIIRHAYAIPQYEADSGERFKAVEEIGRKFPGLVIGGNLRDGIGMADRILQAKKLSEEV